MRALAIVMLLGACGGAENMKGFAERDARAQVAQSETFDACTLRQGRLVLEVERALVREYPHATSDAIHQKKQPLLLLWVRAPGGGPGAAALTPIAAPEEYRAGDPVHFFAGKRLLDLPLRLLRGHRLDIRLAENNRTAAPEWLSYAQAVGHGAAGAADVVGVPAPAEVVGGALGLLAKLDRDDLILLWSVEADELSRALGSLGDHRALRYRLVTTRRHGAEPSAELDLLAYLDPEPGCP